MSTNISQFDTIIVGGGSAGCVLANRLSAEPGHKVLVLEAGRKDHLWDLLIHMPAALTMPIGSPFYDWCYESEPEPHMHNRRIFQGRGKILGGSSSINGMIFQRGNPLDFERWAADPGMDQWDYAHCLPYFKRMENCLACEDDTGYEHNGKGNGMLNSAASANGSHSSDAYSNGFQSNGSYSNGSYSNGFQGNGNGSHSNGFRGKDGPLVLERGPATNPLFGAFFDAVQQAGYPLTDDVNGYKQEGFARFDRNVHQGRRLSASQAYLHPVLAARPNLHVVTRTQATKILFEGKRAVGVEVKQGRNATRYLGGQVILCGGAINSPQLLMLSGVGNAAELSPMGIDMVQDLPGVGENMQDHLEVYVQHTCTQPVSVWPAMQWYNQPWVGLQWLLFKTGAAATNHFEAGGFIRSNEEVAYPNLMFHFLPVAVRYDGTSPGGEHGGGHGYQVHVGPMYSDARGSVKLKSIDPLAKPALRFNYLSTDQDRREWVEAIRAARVILDQPAFAPFSGGEISPGVDIQSDAEILSWVGHEGETAYHPSCTCKMGTDEMAVVDPNTMAVHGLEGLRVVDASVMPYVTNGNIYAPTMMLAEKAADLILGNEPLSATPVDYYRHERRAHLTKV